MAQGIEGYGEGKPEVLLTLCSLWLPVLDLVTGSPSLLLMTIGGRCWSCVDEVCILTVPSTVCDLPLLYLTLVVNCLHC